MSFSIRIVKLLVIIQIVYHIIIFFYYRYVNINKKILIDIN